ncbi:MAG: hypothetical protein L6Q37_11440 [Bdellovibrionaceae bacterium]|nr:hypothetical protein [Pseudobdellovibrionaceae bacterium]NUM59835.1 hypothetical protein [Pseudobdellovibrionaceae bacterium]
MKLLNWYYLHLVFIIIIVAGKVLAANNKVYEKFLPPTENLLLNFVVQREENLKNLVTFIKSECGDKIITKNSQGQNVVTYRRKLRLCYLQAKLNAYYKIQAKIFLPKQDLIYFPDIESIADNTMTQQSRWNLSKILSQNYIIRPNPKGMKATIDLIAELLTQKRELMQELELVGKEMRQLSYGKNLMSYYLIPSLKASINNITPLGAMLELFQSIRCELEDNFCLYLKARIGSVLNEISVVHGEKLTDFVNRFNSYASSEGTQNAKRLTKLLEFNVAYHNSEVQNHAKYISEIKTSIENFVADGEGSFVNDRLQSFAQNILVLAEVSYFTQHLVNLSAYASDLSFATRKQAAKALLPQINQSLEILETQFQLLGFDEEVGGSR